MEKTNEPLTNSIREKAEEILKSRFPITDMPLSEAETLKLIHELRVSQIEFELQNKELLQAKEQKAAYNNMQRYHYMFASNPQPMWIYDLETLAFLEVNNAAVGHYGYSKEEFQSMTLKDIRPKEDIDRLLKDVELTRRTYNPAGEWRHMKKNGEIIHVEIVSHTVTYEGRKARHVMVKDITERKLAEEALQQSEKRSRNALDHLLEGCQIIGFDWRYIYLNHTAEIHNKKPNSELIGNRYMDIWPGIEKTKVFQIIEKTLETRIPDHLENEFIFPDGSLGWFDLSIQPVPEGVFILSIDITERKKKEQQLFESEFRFSKLYENGPFGMVIADKEFRFRNANSTFCTIVGYSEAELQQLTFKDVSHPSDVINDLSNIRKLMNKEISVYKTEKRYIRKDGQVIWGSLTVAATYDSEGQFLYNLGVVEDITRRKQVEEDLRERENKLGTILNLLPVGISILDQYQEIVYENPALENILGITMEGLSQGDFRERKYLRNDGTPKPVEEFASSRVFSEKTAQHNFITGIVKEDGQTVWTNVSAVPVDFPDWKVVLVTADITGIKQTEEELKKSKQLLSETESMGKVGGWEFNIDTLQQTWTDEVYRIHEVDVNFNPNVDNGIVFYTPASRPIVEKAVQRVIEFGEPFDLELEIVTAKGNLRKIHTIGKADFEHRRVYGFFQDITERKLAEEELTKTRNQLEKIFETSPGIVCSSQLRPDGTVCFPYGGERLAEYFGIPTAHLKEDATPYFALIHPDDLKNLLVSIEESARNLTPWRYEWRMLHPVDGLMWIEGHSMPVREQDGSTFWHGVATDITERKRAEEIIRKLNERISTATSASQVGIWDWDVLNNQLTWDDQMYALYGLKKEEFTGAYEAWLSGLHPEDMEFCEDQTNLALQGLKAYDSEFRVVWPDGSIRYLKAKGEVFCDEEGNPIRMLGVNFDITERKRAEENIRKLNDELEQRVLDRTAQLEAANKELEAFSYSVSHDLRAPLRHINGFVDLLNERYNDLLTEKGKHYISVITDASTQMGSLIDDLLEFSRTGRQEMQQINLDMNILLQEVIRIFAEDNKNRKIDWEITKMPIITGDMSLLRMVWVNLISNAVKFTRERDTAKIAIGYTEENKEFIFYIRDNGAGFDMRYVHKLFGVFQRLHTKQQFEGTGIGLANVQRIILKHGGRTWAESELNQGATFYFTIPKIKETQK